MPTWQFDQMADWALMYKSLAPVYKACVVARDGCVAQSVSLDSAYTAKNKESIALRSSIADQRIATQQADDRAELWQKEAHKQKFLKSVFMGVGIAVVVVVAVVSGGG